MYPWNVKQNNAIKMLSAIAHDGRLTLFRKLIQAGPEGVAAGDLARFAGVGATTASAQLLVLANAGLVRHERAGRGVIYYAEYDTMSDLLNFLMKDCCGARQEICAPLAQNLFAKEARK